MKSIFIAFLLIIVPVVGNAKLVDEGTCTGLPEAATDGVLSCNETEGCEWAALGGCGLCQEDSYNDGRPYDSNNDGNNDSTGCRGCPDNSSTGGKVGATSIDDCKCNAGYYKDNTNMCEKCPEPYTSEAGAISQQACFMTCSAKKVENGSWKPDSDKAYYNETCKYENVDNLTCNNGYHKEATKAECVSNEMKCADAWKYGTKTIQYQNKKDEGLSYNNSDDKTVSFLSDKKAFYNTNNDTETWDFTACTGTGTLNFMRNNNPVGQASVKITGTADANWIINITGQEACNQGYCYSGNTFCDSAPKGYYLTENNTACTKCPMGTTSDPGAKNVTACHTTTEDTRFVDNKGNSFSIADLFGGDITLNVTQ